MISLKEAHKTFINNLKEQNKSESTLIAYSKDIEQLIEHLINKGLVLVSEIQDIHLKEFMSNLAEKQYTPKSISRKTNATRTFCKFLKDEDIIVENVAKDLKHPKVVNKDPRILSKLEYRALRDAARDDQRSYAIIEVLLQTGITISEVAEIELTHLELNENEGTLFVPKKNNKEARSIPLNKPVVQAINKYLQDQRPNIKDAKNLFITKTGNSLLVRNIRSTIDRCFKNAGIENAKVNDLRHTFIAHHLSQGVSILRLSKISGHKRISTTEKYLQYVEKPEGIEKYDLGVL